MKPTQLAELLTATGGTATGLVEEETLFEQVVIDSRQVRRGDVFWAIQGKRHDGHDFIREAQDREAALCVIHEPCKKAIGPFIKVHDTQRALWDFSRWYRQQREPLVVGVTGSVGKTTTREMIHAVLSTEHQGIRSSANFNNEIGLPLSLLQIDENHEYAVLEMGACQGGDIRDLCDIAVPEIGVVTGVGPAHLEAFGSVGEIIETKAELLESLPEHGFAVIAGDDSYRQELASRARCPVISVGEGDHHQLCAKDVYAGQRRLSFSVAGERYEVAASGRHHLTAALCAVAVGLEIGIKPEGISQGLRRFVAPAGRCEILQLGPWTVINDTYNSNPASMQAACQLLAAWQTTAKKLVVMGDMLELGESSLKYHRQIGRQIAAAGVDCLLVHGEHAAHVINGAIAGGMGGYQLAHCTDLDSLLIVLDCWLDAGDVVLVKGSRATRMERVVDWIRQLDQEEDQTNNARLLTRAII